MREPLKTRDWQRAEKIKQQWEQHGEKPVSPAAPASIEDLQTKFLANLKTENRSHETIRKYKQLFKRMEAFALEKGIRFVSQFDLTMLEDFRASWKDGDLARQKNQSNLRTIFKYALARKMVQHNAALELGKIRVYDKQHVPFTDEEMESILTAAGKNPKTYALALLMRYSGLAIADATMLRIDDLNGKRLRLRRQKTKREVSILLPDAVVNALHAFESVNKTHFFWNGSVSIKSLTNLYRDFYLRPAFRAAKLAGEPHPHQFRHTFAAKLLTAGTSVENVAALLGNTPKIVWKHYAAWVPERQEALDEAVQRANGSSPVPAEKPQHLDRLRTISVQKSIRPKKHAKSQ